MNSLQLTGIKTLQVDGVFLAGVIVVLKYFEYGLANIQPLPAMKCRGFSGRLLLLQDFNMTRRDHMFAAMLCTVCLGLLFLDYL